MNNEVVTPACRNAFRLPLGGIRFLTLLLSLVVAQLNSTELEFLTKTSLPAHIPGHEFVEAGQVGIVVVCSFISVWNLMVYMPLLWRPEKYNLLPSGVVNLVCVILLSTFLGFQKLYFPVFRGDCEKAVYSGLERRLESLLFVLAKANIPDSYKWSIEEVIHRGTGRCHVVVVGWWMGWAVVALLTVIFLMEVFHLDHFDPEMRKKGRSWLLAPFRATKGASLSALVLCKICTWKRMKKALGIKEKEVTIPDEELALYPGENFTMEDLGEVREVVHTPTRPEPVLLSPPGSGKSLMKGNTEAWWAK